jgi:hypothetical protein
MGKFHAIIKDPFLQDVESRDTIALQILGKNISITIFQFTLGNACFANVIILAWTIGTVIGTLSMIGNIFPPELAWIGYLSLFTQPLEFFFLLQSNVYISKLLLREFTFWVLVILILLQLVSFLFLVRFEAPRVISSLCLCFGEFVAIALFDARLFLRLPKFRTGLIYSLLWGIAAINLITIQLVYVADVMDIDLPQIPLYGKITIPVSSIGMSATQALATWALKSSYAMFYTPSESNPLLIIQANIAYYAVNLGDTTTTTAITGSSTSNIINSTIVVKPSPNSSSVNIENNKDSLV